MGSSAGGFFFDFLVGTLIRSRERFTTEFVMSLSTVALMLALLERVRSRVRSAGTTFAAESSRACLDGGVPFDHTARTVGLAWGMGCSRRVARGLSVGVTRLYFVRGAWVILVEYVGCGVSVLCKGTGWTSFTVFSIGCPPAW